MISKLYYTPPSDEIFNEVKTRAMELWHEVDTDNNKYGYASEKISRIKDIVNIGDNMMYMVAMFDQGNQSRLAEKLSQTARQEIKKRMLDGGHPSYLIVF